MQAIFKEMPSPDGWHWHGNIRSIGEYADHVKIFLIFIGVNEIITYFCQ